MIFDADLKKSFQMENTIIEATYNRPEGDREIDSPVLLIDIPDLIEQLKDENAWHENDRNAITVFKTGKMRIVLVAFHKDAEMKPEKPKNIFSLQVLKGKVKVTTDLTSTEADKGMMVALHEQVSYSIKALKKSVFLLTIIE
jgi:quercetin dioxygenase-like cupin family protein